jgi:lauroyl/myristoyl acyltransferase
MALGPPFLAALTGAALLPIFSVQTGPGAFAVTVTPPIDPDPAERASGYRATLEDYAALMHSYCERYPGQWMGWRHYSYRPAGAGP